MVSLKNMMVQRVGQEAKSGEDQSNPREEESIWGPRPYFQLVKPPCLLAKHGEPSTCLASIQRSYRWEICLNPNVSWNQRPSDQ